MKNFESTFVRDPSPNNLSDDGNSESGTTTIPITEKHISVNNNNNNNKMDKTNYHPMSRNDNFSQGKNAFAFWTIVILLFILTIGNLILTLTIIGVLKLGKGMQHLEVVPEAETVKFYGDTDLDRVYKRDGLIEGFDNVPVSITGDSSAVFINLVNRNGHTHTKFHMSKNGTHFKGINQFEIKDATTGESIFSTHRPKYNIPKSIKNLKANSISVSRITSQVDEDLKFISKGKLILRGVEGTKMDSKELLWSADQNIYLKSINGSIILMGGNGVYIDMKNIPIVDADHGTRAGSVQFKICVCMPQGKLFRVVVHTSQSHINKVHPSKGICTHFNPKHDPCA